jgi:hypothetical protein
MIKVSLKFNKHLMVSILIKTYYAYYLVFLFRYSTCRNNCLLHKSS